MFYRFCKFLLNIAMLLYIFAANKWSIHNILYMLPLQMLVTKMIKHTHNDCLLDECLIKTATYKKRGSHLYDPLSKPIYVSRLPNRLYSNIKWIQIVPFMVPIIYRSFLTPSKHSIIIDKRRTSR